jgi:hypothetical protein
VRVGTADVGADVVDDSGVVDGAVVVVVAVSNIVRRSKPEYRTCSGAA